MTAANFQACLDFVLSQEGGWSDDPNDPGGATNQGITLATYRTFTNNPDASADDLEEMSDAMRDDIYRTMYWTPIRGDDLSAGIDLCIFDFGVNAGPGTSAKELQALVGTARDGVIGPLTLAAVAAEADDVWVICNFIKQRLDYYKSLSKPEFINGWTNRTNACLTAALAMVTAA
jgi:lysozyme family protein